MYEDNGQIASAKKCNDCGTVFGMKEPGGKARIDVNACTRCRLCEKNCPTTAIHIDAV
ncbi:MAG: 4Fe-4S binding protein [Solobacterium sp.]|nr:4Fe-4S binding protein [Solobacterium sp.]